MKDPNYFNKINKISIIHNNINSNMSNNNKSNNNNNNSIIIEKNNNVNLKKYLLNSKSPKKNHSIQNTNISTPIKINYITDDIFVIEKGELKRVVKRRKENSTALTDKPKKECNICHEYIETHLLKIHINSHPSQIFNWMFLGTYSNACDIKELRRIGIRFVLNCASECDNNNLPDNIKELHLNIKDDNKFNLTPFFEESNLFINKVRLSGEIMLIHCKFGISRSVSLIIAYLIKYFGFTVEKALNYIQAKRTHVNPNKGFLDQLIEYERRVKFNNKIKTL